MADKVSFTDFGTKKKVRRVKRKRSKKSGTDPAKLLDEVLEAKKLADETIASVPMPQFSLPFIEFTVTQAEPFSPHIWNELEVILNNTGNGGARNTTISFDRLKTKGQTIVDNIEVGGETTLKIEVKADTSDRGITRMDVFYHSAEGDTFSAIRRDWFPNDYEDKLIFENEVPPGEEENADKYSHREVFSGDLHVVCSKCGARAPTSFRICGKCGSRLKKRDDRRSDWGSNRKEITAVQDEREVLLQKLRKLGELKDRGMLSDEEFSAAKANLLQ